MSVFRVSTTSILMAVVMLTIGHIAAEPPLAGKTNRSFRELSDNGAGPKDDKVEAVPTPEIVPALKMSIRTTASESSDSLRLLVTFENVSNQDTVLNLGMMLGNGRIQSPHAIGLNLTDSQGQSRELHFSDSRYSLLAGRTDVYAVPLPSGAAYTVKLRIRDWYCPSSNELRVELKPGDYRIRATYIGNGPGRLNPDSEGLKFMPFWIGQLRTEWIPFKIGKQA